MLIVEHVVSNLCFLSAPCRTSPVKVTVLCVIDAPRKDFYHQQWKGLSANSVYVHWVFA